MAATALVAGSFASAALAQQPRASRDDDRPTANQLIAQDEARIARLKADLRLKQDQEGDWARFETTLRDLSKQRAERFVAWWDENAKFAAERAAQKKNGEAPKPMTMAEGLKLRADILERQAAELRKIADATEPLFNKLDDAQKRRVAEAVRQYTATPLAEAPGPRNRRGNWFR
jgi:hypothetical protein